MQSLHKLTSSERKKALRAAILRRHPKIPLDLLNHLCEVLNTKRPYLIKHTSDKQKFLNLATREFIVTEGVCVLCEVIPIYGQFHCPFFSKIGPVRHIEDGHINDSIPASAVKIRVAKENNRYLSTHTLILFG